MSRIPVEAVLRTGGCAVVVCAVIGFANPATAWAQAQSADQMFRALDRNGDGALSLEDARDNNRAMLEQILQMARKPVTGRVSREEFQGVFDAHQRGGGRTSPGTTPRPEPNPEPAAADARGESAAELLLRWCDENHDGRVTRAEWSRLTQQFRTLDRNGDGTLDAAELAALEHPAPEHHEVPVATSSSSNRLPTSNRATATGRANLEGVWRGWVVRGRGEDPNSGEMEVELTVRGNRIDGRELGTNRGPPGGLGSGTFTLSGDGRSGTLDAEQTTGPDAGRTYLGIYELSGETLRWCVTGRNRQRPEMMATERGNFLMILRRQPGG